MTEYSRQRFVAKPPAPMCTRQRITDLGTMMFRIERKQSRRADNPVAVTQSNAPLQMRAVDASGINITQIRFNLGDPGERRVALETHRLPIRKDREQILDIGYLDLTQAQAR